jgi:hypothetical protein
VIKVAATPEQLIPAGLEHGDALAAVVGVEAASLEGGQVTVDGFLVGGDFLRDDGALGDERLMFAGSQLTFHGEAWVMMSFLL